MENANVLFLRWFTDNYLREGWYKKMHISFTMPNLMNSDYLKDKENGIELGVFEKIDQSENARLYLQLIVEKADELDVALFLEPTPRLKYITDSKKKEKITRAYLIDYYSEFGFIPMSDKIHMERKPTATNYSIGGL